MCCQIHFIEVVPLFYSHQQWIRVPISTQSAPHIFYQIFISLPNLSVRFLLCIYLISNELEHFHIFKEHSRLSSLIWPGTDEKNPLANPKTILIINFVLSHNVLMWLVMQEKLTPVIPLANMNLITEPKYKRLESTVCVLWEE